MRPMRLFAPLLTPLAELSVIGSYARSGYRLRAARFTDDLEVDLTGKRVAITGATSGIGLAAAKELAGRGASVILVGRSADKLAAAAGDIPGAAIERCDLSDLDEARALAERLAVAPLDALVHNAGLIAPERRLTAQGHESAFATHVLAPFLLSNLLAPALRAAHGRLVWVSSGGMYTQRLDLDKAQALTGPYDGVRAYAQHKRAQVLLSELFARLLAPEATSNAMHPGWVDTPGVEVGLPRFHRRLRWALRTPEQGADTIVWQCAARGFTESGRFYLDRKARRTELLWGTRHTEADRRALWELCAELTRAYAPATPGAPPSPS